MAVPVEAVPTTDLCGRTVGDRYLLTGQLGRGGFGVVYAGRDLQGQGEVAVKVFSRAEGFAPRAEREARTASKLDHPNIHHCIGVEEDCDHAYLISRLVIGERFDRSDLDDEEAIRAVAAVCDALAHAHACGVVHRDVKPSNILIGDDGNVTLTDFGIARDEDARDATLDERVLGTLSYMAPEQARGDQATGATDVWAAALTLYEALSGTNPFRTKSLSDLLSRLEQGAPPLTHARPDLHKSVARTVHRALDRDPRRRPDAAAFRDQLLALLRTEDEEQAAAEPTPPCAALPGPAAPAGAVRAPGIRARAHADGLPCVPGVVDAAAGGAGRRPCMAVSADRRRSPLHWSACRRSGTTPKAAPLVYALLVGVWLVASRRSGARMLTPLLAGPMALAGLAPLYVLIAATAPTTRRRAAEAVAGGLVATLWSGVAAGAGHGGPGGHERPPRLRPRGSRISRAALRSGRPGGVRSAAADRLARTAGRPPAAGAWDLGPGLRALRARPTHAGRGPSWGGAHCHGSSVCGGYNPRRLGTRSATSGVQRLAPSAEAGPRITHLP